MSAVNGRDNVVFININTYWGTVSKRSGMTEQKIFTRMLYNVSWKHEAVQATWLSSAAEERLHLENSGRCQEYRAAGPQQCLCGSEPMWAPGSCCDPKREGGLRTDLAEVTTLHCLPSFFYVEDTSLYTWVICKSSHICGLVSCFSERNCCFNNYTLSFYWIALIKDFFKNLLILWG